MSSLSPGYAAVPPRAAPAFGPHVDVPFDPAALDAKRHWFRRRYGLNLAVLICGFGPLLLFIAIWTLALNDPADKMQLLIGSAVGLLVPAPIALAFLVKSTAVLIRTRSWPAGGPEQRLAFRLSPDGIWISAEAPHSAVMLGWHSVIWAAVRNSGGPTLDIDLAPGVQAPREVVGFELATSAPPRFLSTFGNRGPRFYLETLAVPPPVIDAALRHYTDGRLGLGR